jgi:hypothetical protein
MFKKLVPVIALALIAGPVFAADTPAASTAPAADKSTTTTSSKHHKKHHDKKSSTSTKPADSSTAPAK